MQIYALRLFNFFRFGEKRNSIVFDILPEYKNFDIDKLYDTVMSDPVAYVEKVKEHGITNITSIAGMIGNTFDFSNGSGKSTLLEGICYLLYDRIVRKGVNSDKTANAGLSVVTKLNGKFPSGLQVSYVEGLIEENGKLYRIKRGRKFTKNQKSHSPFLEFECITADKCDSFSSHRTGDTNEAILEVLDRDFEIFVNSIMFGQSDAGKFLTGTDKTRKEMIINLLHVTKIISGKLEKIRTRKNVKEKEIATIEAQISLLEEKVADGIDVKDLKKEIQERETQIVVLDKEIKESDEQIASFSKSEILLKVRSLGETLEQSNSELGKKDNELKQALAEIKVLYENVINTIKQKANDKEKICSEIKSNEVNLQKIEKEISEFDLGSKKAHLEKAEKYKDLEQKYTGGKEKLRLELDTINEDLTKERTLYGLYNEEVKLIEKQLREIEGDEFVCEKCKSNVTRKHIEDELEKSKVKLNQAKEKGSTIKKNADGVTEKLKEVEKRLKTINEWKVKEVNIQSEIKENENKKSKILDINKDIEYKNDLHKDLEKEIENLESEKTNHYNKGLEKKNEHEKNVASLKEKVTLISNEIASLQSDYDNISKKIGELKSVKSVRSNEKSSNLSIIGSLKTKIKNVEENSNKLNELKKSLADAKLLLGRLLILEDVYGLEGIQTRVVKKYLPLLNFYVKEVINVLTDGAISVEMFINKKSKVDIRISGASSEAFEMASGGEKMIIRLATDIGLARLSFSRSTQKPEMICLDEIFAPLDVSHTEMVFKLLDVLKDKFNRVLVISHKENINDKIDNRIIVEKEAGDFGRSLIKTIV